MIRRTSCIVSIMLAGICVSSSVFAGGGLGLQLQFDNRGMAADLLVLHQEIDDVAASPNLHYGLVRLGGRVGIVLPLFNANGEVPLLGVFHAGSSSQSACNAGCKIAVAGAAVILVAGASNADDTQGFQSSSGATLVSISGTGAEGLSVPEDSDQAATPGESESAPPN